MAIDDPEDRPEHAGYDSARARYEKALSLRSGGSGSGSSSSVTGDSSRPRRLGSIRTAPNEALVSIATEDVDQERVSPSVNVRERAAKFATPTNSGSISKTSWRPSSGAGSGRSIDEDEGDIPMRTSLSPRKIRTEEWNAMSKPSSLPPSDLPIDGTKPVALRSWRQRERSQESSVDHSSRGRVKAIVFDADDGAATGVTARHRDLGRQRRHINLSGARLVRQADRGDGASPVRGNHHSSNREV